jgi:type II secretory pathway component PulF
MLIACARMSRAGSLSEAMAKHPKAFDRLYCKMVAPARSAACST